MNSNVLSFPQRKGMKSDVDELQLDSNGFILRLPLGAMKFEQAHEELMNTIDLFSDLANSNSISRQEAFQLKESGEKIRKCLAIFANMIALLEIKEKSVAGVKKGNSYPLKGKKDNHATATKVAQPTENKPSCPPNLKKTEKLFD